MRISRLSYLMANTEILLSVSQRLTGMGNCFPLPAAPFLEPLVVVLALITAFPELVLWLPRLVLG